VNLSCEKLPLKVEDFLKGAEKKLKEIKKKSFFEV
jgi:hypothetical protein